jgi:hypothetical protein
MGRGKFSPENSLSRESEMKMLGVKGKTRFSQFFLLALAEKPGNFSLSLFALRKMILFRSEI